ncbi:hypothetical protein C0995_015540 [Termitomyces sp. Mi166|nr:hypothetical protein C0995_015540 [Termitomyces sp. Mi166\
MLLPVLLLSVLQLACAINVYLSPRPAFVRSSLSPQLASSTLSRHLGVDVFEPLRDASHSPYNEDPFIATGSRSALLLTLDEVDAAVILPPSLRPAFNLHATSSAPVGDSLSSAISTFLHRAAHTFTSIYDGAASPLELAAFFESAETPSFAALEMTKLSDLRRIYGSNSSEYHVAAEGLREVILEACNRPDTFSLAILTFSTPVSSFGKRDTQPQASQSPLVPSHPPPQEPIGAISTCFTSAAACINSTDSCSGRGQCLEATKSGRTCYVCTCGVTRSGEGPNVKTDVWVGQSCEKKDVSGPFVLLTGTVIVLLVLVFGSVSLLSTVGNVELPSVLLATAVGVKKD